MFMHDNMVFFNNYLNRFYIIYWCRWSLIAGRLPGRTANDVKNYWNTHMRKKEISRIKDVEEEVQGPVKVNVIKPQPMTLSKNFTWVSKKPISVESFQLNDNVSNISPTLMPLENTIDWWECLLEGEKGDEIAPCSLSDCLEPESSPNIWTEEIGPQAKVGDITFDGEGLNCWGDLSFDMGLWDVPNAESERGF
jgi:hypothetical protein